MKVVISRLDETPRCISVYLTDQPGAFFGSGLGFNIKFNYTSHMARLKSARLICQAVRCVQNITLPLTLALDVTFGTRATPGSLRFEILSLVLHHDLGPRPRRGRALTFGHETKLCMQVNP